MVWHKTFWKTDSVMNVRHTANEEEHCNRKCTRAKQCRSIQSMLAEPNFNVSALRTTLSSSNLFLQSNCKKNGRSNHKMIASGECVCRPIVRFVCIGPMSARMPLSVCPLSFHI